MPDVIMPKMGDSMEVGKLLSWRKRSGETVKSGEVIAEIETDKSNVEIEAENDGILQTSVQEGAEVPVGEVIATIGVAKSAAAVPGEKKAEKSSAVTNKESSAPVSASSVEKRSVPPMSTNGQFSSTPSQERLKVSPLARRVAREKQIDIAQLSGTGPNGRIIEADVLAFEAKPAAVAPQKPQLSAAPSVLPVSPQGTVHELSQMRRVIARRMVESKTTIPHFYITVEVDMDDAVALREKLNSFEENLPKISLNDFVVKACAKALVKFPDVNSVFQNDKVITSAAANVGVAVALDDGLIVPVIKGANALSLRALAVTAKELIQKARGKKLQPSEYSGGSFTVSNLGGYDVENFIAIIDPSQGAILAVSTIVKKPVVVNDQIVVRQRMNLTLSGDHRVIDGATGAKFAQEVKRLLQNPLSLIE
jgi:pyruvate dehydrogenase E2 component (dihydrolipoamide acetyltransferase)